MQQNPKAQGGATAQSAQSSSQGLGKPDTDNGHGKDFVTITVNGKEKSIHRGHQPVSEIKRVGGVDQADVLAQVIDGQLKDMPDDGAVVIKGGEEFVSHVRDGQSS